MNRNTKQVSEEEMEQAIRSFRQSVTAWSEMEAARVESGARRAGRPTPAWLSWWVAAGAAGATVAACALAALMLTSGHNVEPRQMAQSVTVRQSAPPTAEATHAAPATTDSASRENQPTTLEASTAPITNKASGDADDSDEKLLAGIDSDIAQGTPKALAPMAGWMGDSAEQ